MTCTIANNLSDVFTTKASSAARERMLSRRGERLFVAGWERVLMMHFEVDAAALQRAVPFQLDLYHGRAFVSLVAFTMRGLRPCFGGKLTALLFRPIASHDFLNVRTYVRQGGEPGIHFIAEWLSNRLAATLGPATFGLPYRHGRIQYYHDWQGGVIRGRVTEQRRGTAFRYLAAPHQPASFHPCKVGSLDEWLMERYIAFNSAGGWKRSFRVWHPPWPQCPAKVAVLENSLLTENWPWFAEANLIGANYSDGFDEVWMGRPHSL
ncbi:MAG TPA: DUF2071 domain-containing protein [Verrucomicrobiae bacterium]|nr:DUF2071 domain-containing protein [Verrucomicrobiae bacterium]